MLFGEALLNAWTRLMSHKRAPTHHRLKLYICIKAPAESQTCNKFALFLPAPLIPLTSSRLSSSGRLVTSRYPNSGWIDWSISPDKWQAWYNWLIS
jgi:hypothetical protein